MERVVDGGFVGDIPDLQLANPDRLVVVMRLLVDREVHTMLQTQLESQPALASRSRISGYERLDSPQVLRDHGARRCCGTDDDRREPLRSFLAPERASLERK